jgi:CheY-like chemotaxis protein
MLVADSGEPLPGNDAERLFEPDVILRHGAVGVGLIATKTIVDNHSGWIQVRSEPGVGTIIAVYWPALTDRISTPERFERAPSSQTRALPTTPPLATTRPPGYTAPPPPPPPPPQSTATTGLPVSGPPGSQQRVLIIDDEELVRTSVSGMFKVLGYSAETAWDGAEGIQKFIRARDAGHSFCLVVVDLVVPLGMGAEMAVKEFARLDPNLQVIVTSGYTDHPAVTSFRNYGFRAFLKKPFGLREIKAVLKSIELPAPR